MEDRRVGKCHAHAADLPCPGAEAQLEGRRVPGQARIGPDRGHEARVGIDVGIIEARVGEGHQHHEHSRQGQRLRRQGRVLGPGASQAERRAHDQQRCEERRNGSLRERHQATQAIEQDRSGA
jgi:hypothetical protein